MVKPDTILIPLAALVLGLLASAAVLFFVMPEPQPDRMAIVTEYWAGQ